MEKVGDLAYVIVDTRETATGVGFWSRLLGRPVTGEDPPYTGLGPTDGSGVTVALQQVGEWREGHSGIHVDVKVPDLDTAIRQTEALGGRLVEVRGTTERWAVMPTRTATPSAWSPAGQGLLHRSGVPPRDTPRRLLRGRVTRGETRRNRPRLSRAGVG